MFWEKINNNNFAHRCEINGYSVTRFEVLGKFKSQQSTFEYVATKEGCKRIETKDLNKLLKQIAPAAEQPKLF